MRGNLSEQDLTDYALNELPPRERLYVESMLAASEPCREDVRGVIDMAMLLEEGFEAEGHQQLAELRPEQRAALLEEQPASRSWGSIALALAAAAAVALAAVYQGFWRSEGPSKSVVRVSNQVSGYVMGAMAPDDSGDFSGLLADVGQLSEDPVLKKWFSSDWFGGDRSMQSMAFAPASASSWESMPYIPMDGM